MLLPPICRAASTKAGSQLRPNPGLFPRVGVVREPLEEARAEPSWAVLDTHVNVSMGGISQIFTSRTLEMLQNAYTCSFRFPFGVYLLVYTCTPIHVHIHINTTHTHMHIYIYVYTYIYVCARLCAVPVCVAHMSYVHHVGPTQQSAFLRVGV